jgi:hypothetical protein
MSRKHGKPRVEDDLEATAELPIPEFDEHTARDLPVLAASPTPEHGTETDVLPVPAIPVGAIELAESLREVEQRLQRKIERQAELETQLAESRRRESALGVELSLGQELWLQQSQHKEVELQQEIDRLRAALTEAQAQLQSRLVAEQRVAAERREAEDIAELRRRSELQYEALTNWYGFRALADSRLAEAEARVEFLEIEVATVAARPAEVDATRLQGLAMQVGELKTANEVLDAELSGARQGQRDAEEQLHAANDRIRKLEAELQANAAVLASLQQNINRLGRDESGSRPVLRPAAPENPKRVLIRQEGNAEVVYPIGRRTSIGRTQENDIQIDTVHVSRRHAVLLSNSDHCIVEDLNSTNGVLVNGRRIGRQLLQDGDIVMVGKTEFRYQQRP